MAYKADFGVVSCNRVAACGATFHLICLTSKKYDIHAHDGCIKCNASSENEITQEKYCDDGDHVQQHKTVMKRELGVSHKHAEIIMIDAEYNDDETDDVVVLD